MFQFGDNRWKVWNQAMKRALLDHQRTDGDEAGSFDPIDARGRESGRVGGTSLAALTLQTCYR